VQHRRLPREDALRFQVVQPVHDSLLQSGFGAMADPATKTISFFVVPSIFLPSFHLKKIEYFSIW